MPDAPTPLDLDAIRAMLGDRLAVTTRSVALDLLAEVEHLTAEVQERDEWLHETAALLPEGFDGDEWEGEVIACFIRQAARPAPAWDEEAVVEGMARAVYPSLFTDDRQPLRVFGETRSDAELREGERNVARERMRQALAVVREHLPVKPDREAVARALAEHRLMGGRCRCGLDPRLDYYRYEQHVTDAVLAEWPGESRAQVEATALRDAVEKYAVTIPDALGYKVPAVTTEDLLDRADRLAAEGGADRG